MKEASDNIATMGVLSKQMICFFIFLVGWVAIASAQLKAKIEHYSTEQGLSHQQVTAILKDREGFFWFGTWDGINRFDGHRFFSYKSSPGDSSQLRNDRIDQIIEDQAGYLWLLAYDRQVYRFDKKTGQFLPLSTVVTLNGKGKVAFRRILSASNGFVWIESVEEGVFCVPQADLAQGRFTQYNTGMPVDYRLPSNTIIFFHQDSAQQLWIGTANGLVCLIRSASGHYKRSHIVPAEFSNGVNISAVAEDANSFYFSTADGRLITFHKQDNSFSAQKLTVNRLNSLLRSKKGDMLYATTAEGDLLTIRLPDQRVTTIRYATGEALFGLFEDRQGRLWIEPQNAGVVLFDPLRQSFQFFSLKNKAVVTNLGNRFRVLEDEGGNVWINMKQGGFGYYNPAKGTIDNLLNTPDATTYQLPRFIYSIYYDHAGILWFTTYEKELVKVILQEDDFKQHPLSEQGLTTSDNEARGMLYDSQNRLWIGAKSGKLYVYQNGKQVTGLFENEPAEGLGLVYSILQDSRGNIWLGTKGNGLYKATPLNREATTYRLTHFRMDTNDPKSLQANEIYALLEDRRGRIWVGSFDNGLSLVEESQLSTKFIAVNKALKNYPKGAFHKIRHLAEDGAGNIWAGTTDGLVLLHTQRHQSPQYTYHTYNKIPGDKESLGNNNIQFIYRDTKSRMWLATSGGGIALAIGRQPLQALQFRNYTTKDGMPNDYVLSLAEDKRGNLWLATENGLSKFNPETKEFRNYDSYDGLTKASFSEAAVRRLPDGSLVFGTTKGYVTVNPGRINKNAIPANIVFTNLQINNEDVGPGLNEAVLKTNINYISELTLNYNQNIISIDYAILDHRAGNRQAFAYRLVGFDTTWHNDQQFRRATYTNLPPGKYVFEVKSGTADLYSNNPYKRLAITILPPPWKTWWAYTLYAILAGTLLYFIRRYTVAMIRLRNKIAVEQKLAALKLAFFTNVSHELRTPLTLIVNPLEQLSKKEKLSPEGTAFVDVARKNAARMVRFINQLLDLRKVQSDKATLRISRVEMVTFIKKIAEHFTEAARSKRIKLEICAEQKELIVWVDAEKLDVVIYNLLGNAVKFTPDGKAIRISIHSLPDEQNFLIAVQDEGPGVEKNSLEEIFELFHEGQQSAGRALQGSGIGLALSREFVNLQGGRIWAENNKDGGLTVSIKLKLGAEHYNRETVSFTDMPKTAPVYERPLEQQLLPVPVNAGLPIDREAPLVLLVEDNDELRNFLKGQLGEFYRVEVARNGEEGWQKAVQFIPDLIVSDIMMPVMDGIQMLDKVRHDLNTSHIPVVLLSAKYSIESQIEGLKYGADYYITKPFNNEFLIASIDNLVRQRKRLFESLVERKKPVELGPEPIVVTSKDELFLKEVIRTVENKMAEPEFNIELVAESMAMSRTTFYKKFKSLTNLTPVEFVRDMRLQRAKQYLDAGGSNVSEVAYLVGFSNPKYFSTCFREKYHVSPSDYLKAKIV